MFRNHRGSIRRRSAGLIGAIALTASVVNAAPASASTYQEWGTCPDNFPGSPCTVTFSVDSGPYSAVFTYMDFERPELGLQDLLPPYEGVCFESTCTVSIAGRGDTTIPIGWTVAGENPSIEMME